MKHIKLKWLQLRLSFWNCFLVWLIFFILKLYLNIAYSAALKQLIEDICKSQSFNGKCIGYIAQKIVCGQNDNIGMFIKELKRICGAGYNFDPLMVNRLMKYCTEHFDMNFHQFVLTQIVNKLTKSKLDNLNESILREFVERRLLHERQLRIGLSRRTAWAGFCSEVKYATWEG